MGGLCIFVLFGILLPCAILKWVFKTQPQAYPAKDYEPDPHCDMCASGKGNEPVEPVMRCEACCLAMYHILKDPLWGFDFKKYVTNPKGGCHERKT